MLNKDVDVFGTEASSIDNVQQNERRIKMRRFEKSEKHREAGTFIAIFVALISFITLTLNVYADVPGRALPSGAVPNPGTQQQELANITAPAEWNVFEFVVTCGACHAGTVDQHTGHFGNWAGGNMASAARDPIFRAAQIGANNTVKAVTGQDGAGNVCFRCHSPNGWLSGRFDPTLGGKADGSNMIQSILASTDGEGISCETCHRTVGNVTYKRVDPAKPLNDPAQLNFLDKVWNLLAGLFDWEHGIQADGTFKVSPMVDQVGTPTIAQGNPYGDTTLQFLDGMTYIGKYSGMTDVYFSDLPIGGSYTGQIYAVYPPDWKINGNPVNNDPKTGEEPLPNSAGQIPAYNLDGTLPPLFEVPISTPTLGGSPVFSAQAFSIEHPTVGGAGRQGSQFDYTGGATPTKNLSPALAQGPGGSTSPNEFIRSSEFCGTCHDLTVPVLSHGMPEQRTFSEWKYSSFSQASHTPADPLKKRTAAGAERCQDCHMPTLKHEYSDADRGTYNADPILVGGFPYGKNRSAHGGTAIHKLTGSNRDLPDMMKVLYPEVDLEVIGAPTGKDPRVFPGMLSDRSPMWDRAKQNTEITLRDGVDVKITQPPTETTTPGVYEMKVKVTNQSGHRIPSGYPDGRRFWLSIQAKDAANAVVYESGVYDAANAELKTDGNNTAFKRALTNTIDATTSNAVMVYERVTGMCNDSTGAWIYPEPASAVAASCTPSPAVINNFILFDNRIPPRGFDAANARNAGIKFWSYNPATFAPVEDQTRFDAAQQAGGYDEVTYRFTAPSGSALTASAEVYWQTHNREFMEHLRADDSSTVRPQGPPNPFAPNYPNVPTYLSDSINGQPLSSYTALDGSPLNDNWGGVAYAAWLATGKGAPFLVDRDDTAVTAAPGVPTLTVRALEVTDPEFIDPVTLAPNTFAAKLSWVPVADADGYVIWVRYGVSEATADWDRLAIKVGNGSTSHLEHLFNPGKTYGFKVVAYNGAGETESAVVNHTVAPFLPNAPTGLTASNDAATGSTASQITLKWNDNALNEAGFEVWRFGPMSVNGVPVVYNGQPPMAVVGGDLFNAANGGLGTQTGGPVGGQPTTGLNTYIDVDAALLPKACYNYQVRAVTNNVDVSTWALAPNQGCTIAARPTVNLAATAASGTRVDLTWNSNATGVANYRLTRTLPTPQAPVLLGGAAFAYADTTVVPSTTYAYQIEVLDVASAVLATTTTIVTTPAVPVAPSALNAVATTTQITLSWTDNSNNEDGFVLERSDNGGQYQQIPGVGVFTLPGVTSFVDTAVLQNVTYQYRVKAIHLVNGDSGYAIGTPVKLVTIPVLAATLLSLPPATVNLVWTASSASDSFKVARTAAGTATLNCATAAYTYLGNATPAFSTTDATVAANKYYCYKVEATNTAGIFTSVPVKIFIPVAPATPTNLTLSGITATGLTINWAASAGLNVPTGYEIQKCSNASLAGICASNGAGWATMGTSVVTNYSVTGLTAGSPYFFRVRAFNPATSAWLNSTVFARPVAVANTATGTATTAASQSISAGNVLTNDLPTGLTGRTVINLSPVTHTGAPTSVVVGTVTYPVTSAVATASCTAAGVCTVALSSPAANAAAPTTTAATNARRQASKRGTYTFTYTEQYITNYGTFTSGPVPVTVTVN
jgi:hypothetical protein